MFSFLSSHGVLGLNARNLLYIKPFNPRKAVAFADDKLKTKAFLSARGIPTAKIFARIEDRKQLQGFDFGALPDECVLKPNEGYGGEGILVLNGRNKRGQFLIQGKEPISERDMRAHVEDILDGKFSLSGRSDTAFFERLLVADEAFAPLRPAGLPDIRIVVFNLVPVMAMLRLPTAESGGKANVHLGGIGIGIDIAKGLTTFATQYNRRIRELPHGLSPAGFQIPRWEEMLLVASRIQHITNIGYLAVDLTLDQEQGPVLLEVNARAGLMVQVANLAPLRSRLERVEGVTVTSPEKGVRIAQELFGEKVRERRGGDAAEDRPVLGLRETIVLAGEGVTAEVPALIAPAEERTIFTEALLRELEEQGIVERVEEGFRAKFTLGGRKIQTVVRAQNVADPSVRAVVGRRDLAGFLIDPGKATGSVRVRPSVKEDLRAIDKTLEQADHDLLLLKELKPVNLEEERVRLEHDRSYNPVFRYHALPANLDEMETRLVDLKPDESPLGELLKKKRRELLLRINLLRARGDARRFTEASASLFGRPATVLLTAASAVLRSRTVCELPPSPGKMLSADEAAERFRAVMEQYGLHEWKVSVRDALVADCTVGGREVYLRGGARFTPGHLEALIAHEIETHVLTAENGASQPFELFRRGFAQYLDTQEGLAIFNQNRILSPHHDKRYGPARNVLAIAYVLEHSLAQTRRYLEEELGYGSEKALSKAIDFKRGLADTAEPGGFTKGLVYFRGLRAIEEFVGRGGDLRKLYVGKIALEDLDLIAKIPGIREPILLPVWLREKKEANGKPKKAK